ncbi:MAG: hypothetical protein ACOH2R_02930, partial [Pseudomonas sp.]
CPGTFIAKAGAHAILDGEGVSPSLPKLPVGSSTKPPSFMELNYHDEWLTPLAGAAYTALFEDGCVRQGKLDDNGYARLDSIPNEAVRVIFAEDVRPHDARIKLPDATFVASADSNETAFSHIKGHLQATEQVWQDQTQHEQREVQAQLNTDTPDAEDNLWHYLNEAQQTALRTQLAEGKS